MEGSRMSGLELTYEKLPQTEEAWAELRFFLDGVKGFIPPAALGSAAVARNEAGEIVGAVVLQMVPYLGPLRVREDCSGKVDFKKLREVVDSFFGKDEKGPLIIQGYIVLTDSPDVARIAENSGMKRKDGATLLIRNVDEEAPVPYGGE